MSLKKLFYNYKNEYKHIFRIRKIISRRKLKYQEFQVPLKQFIYRLILSKVSEIIIISLSIVLCMY